MSMYFLNIKVRLLLLWAEFLQLMEDSQRAGVATEMWVSGYTDFEIDQELKGLSSKL